MIMREGRILAADTPENLEKSLGRSGHIIAEIEAPLDDLRDCFDAMAEVSHHNIAPAEGQYHRCSLTAVGGEDLRPKIFAMVRERDWKLRELFRLRHSLEDVYIRLTRPESEEELR
jgi:ABC-2 type transport system ATP-binding protein